MTRTAIAIGLAALLLAAAGTGAQAMPVAPVSKVMIEGLSDVTQASWRQCWRDRWGAGTAGAAGAIDGGVFVAGEFAS